MRRLAWFKVSSLIILIVFLGVCISTAIANDIRLDSITISPASPSISLEQTQQITVIGNYSDGSHQDLTASSSYALNTSVATINAGVVTPVASGSTVVEIKYHGKRTEADLTVFTSSGTAALVTGSTTIIASSSKSLKTQ